MAEINPAEVSAILKQQLANFETQSNVEEVGTVLTIGDGIALVYGLENVQYGELVKFQSGPAGTTIPATHLAMQRQRLPVSDAWRSKYKSSTTGQRPTLDRAAYHS